jgi:hypothetical protein
MRNRGFLLLHRRGFAGRFRLTDGASVGKVESVSYQIRALGGERLTDEVERWRGARWWVEVGGGSDGGSVGLDYGPEMNYGGRGTRGCCR